MKKCNTCSIVKPYNEFNKRSEGGLRYECIECRRKRYIPTSARNKRNSLEIENQVRGPHPKAGETAIYF